MKKHLVRVLVWLLRKVRGEDPAPTVEPGSRIIHDGVEYICTCTELDTDPAPKDGPRLTMKFVDLETLARTRRIILPMPVKAIEFTLEYDEEELKAILEESENTTVTVLHPAPADYSKCRNCLCNDCAPCQRRPVHPCQSCGDRPDPPLAVGQRCPSRELWKH